MTADEALPALLLRVKPAEAFYRRRGRAVGLLDPT